MFPWIHPGVFSVFVAVSEQLLNLLWLTLYELMYLTKFEIDPTTFVNIFHSSVIFMRTAPLLALTVSPI